MSEMYMNIYRYSWPHFLILGFLLFRYQSIKMILLNLLSEIGHPKVIDTQF